MTVEVVERVAINRVEVRNLSLSLSEIIGRAQKKLHSEPDFMSEGDLWTLDSIWRLLRDIS